MKLPRPQRLPSTTYELPTNCGKIYITVTTDRDGLPFEIFARFGKAGSCGAAIFDGLTKIVSYALRSGMDPADAVKAFSGISCSHGRNTCLNAASAALKEVLDALPSEDPTPSPSPDPPPVPPIKFFTTRGITMEVLANPLIFGILIGLAAALYVAIRGWVRRRVLLQENVVLQKQLNQMKINDRGNQAILLEVEQLKKQNENLRISLAALKNRPDRSELKTLYLYDHAVRLMMAKAPGFAPAWESVMSEVEIELEKNTKGLIPGKPYSVPERGEPT